MTQSSLTTERQLRAASVTECEEQQERDEPEEENGSDYLHDAGCECGDCIEYDSPEYYGE